MPQGEPRAQCIRGPRGREGHTVEGTEMYGERCPLPQPGEAGWGPGEVMGCRRCGAQSQAVRGQGPSALMSVLLLPATELARHCFGGEVSLAI